MIPTTGASINNSLKFIATPKSTTKNIINGSR